MEPVLSVAAILSSPEAQIAEQRAQETFHAKRETFHRGSRNQRLAGPETKTGALEAGCFQCTRR